MPIPPIDQRPSRNMGPATAARGRLRLVVGGARPASGSVQGLQAQLASRGPPPRGVVTLSPPTWPDDGDSLPPPRGLTGRTRRSVPEASNRTGDGLDGLLAPFDSALASDESSTRRHALVSALNGVLGDHLLRSGNPLAIPMQLRSKGRPLDAAALGRAATQHVLLQVHDLCQSDLGWRRNGHDHGELLARALAAAPVQAWYNTGRNIADNGQALAERLERLLTDWPVPIQRLTILGHGMGGLVARSALAQGEAAGHRWPQVVDKLVFIGTPHHGVPLERAGNWLHRVMDLGAYAAPFARLSRLRSEGITDLRHGRLLQVDWQGASPVHPGERRSPVPLPRHLQAFAIASTAGAPGTAGSLIGDGLVPVHSALGRHKRRALDLALPATHQWVGQGIHHLDLLCDPAVYRRILGWLI